MVIPLSHIRPGERARIVWIASEPRTRQRLHDLGFAPNEELRCVFAAARGGMRAFQIQGAVIALRLATAGEIFAELIT